MLLPKLHNINMLKMIFTIINNNNDDDDDDNDNDYDNDKWQQHYLQRISTD